MNNKCLTCVHNKNFFCPNDNRCYSTNSECASGTSPFTTPKICIDSLSSIAVSCSDLDAVG